MDPMPNLPPISPAAERNKQPIVEQLQLLLPPRGLALEIAAGTGQHAAWFAAAMPGWVWQPTDSDPEALIGISAWCAQSRSTNVRSPLLLDVLAMRWPAAGPLFTEPFDAVYCANMIHISAWASCAALMRGGVRHLALHGIVVLYGPFTEDDVPTSEGNLAFDASLRQRNAQWGLRRLADVVAQAHLVGLRLQSRREMPADNLLLVFGRGQ